MKTRLFLIPCAALSLLAASCAKESVAPQIADGSVWAVFEQPSFNGEITKAYSATADGLSFHWDAEKISVFPSEGSEQMTYTMQASSSANGTFSVNKFKLVEGESYYAVYPAVGAVDDNTAIPVSFTGQKQLANGDATHLSKFSYGTASATVSSNSATFNFTSAVAWLKLNLTFNADCTVKDVTVSMDSELIPTEGTLNAKTGVLTATAKSKDISLNFGEGIEIAKGSILTGYIAVAPFTTSTGVKVTAGVVDEEGSSVSLDASTSAGSVAIQANGVYAISRTLLAEDTKLTSGTFAAEQDPSENVAEGYYAKRDDNGTWTIAKFPLDYETPQIEGKVISVGNAKQLAWVSAQVARGRSFADTTILLTSNIDLSVYDAWEPIGTVSNLTGGVNPGKTNTTEKTFQGIFDGNGKTISAMTVNKTGQIDAGNLAGLFGRIYKATIKDVTIDGASVYGRMAGGIAGSMSASVISGCTVTNSTIESTPIKISGLTTIASSKSDWTDGSWQHGSKVGGIVGQLGGTVSGCEVSATTLKARKEAGGIAGCGSGSVSGNTIAEGVSILLNPKANGRELLTESASYAGAYLGKDEGTASVSDDNNGTVSIDYLTIAEALEGGYGTSGVITLGSGNYNEVIDLRDITAPSAFTLKAMSGKTVTIAGFGSQNNTYKGTGKFEGITFDNSLASGWFTGVGNSIAPCVGVWGGNFEFEDCIFDVDGSSGKETGVMTYWTTTSPNLTFTNCTFNGTASKARAMQLYGDNGVNVTATGCTFNTANDYAVKYTGHDGNVAKFENCNVTNGCSECFIRVGDGTYSGKPSYKVYLNDITLADGISTLYIVKHDESQAVYVDGELDYSSLSIGDTKYANLSEAVAAANDGDVIKLVRNFDLTSSNQITFNSSVTLDLNGKTLDKQADGSDKSSYIFSVASGKTLTIKNGTIDGKKGCYRATGGSGNVVLENVTFTGNILYASNALGSMTATDCEFNGWLSGWTGTSSFTNCNFASKGCYSGDAICYGGTTTFTDCTFFDNTAGVTNPVDGIDYYVVSARGAAGQTVNFVNCKWSTGATVDSKIFYVNSKAIPASVTIDGVELMTSK